MNRNDYRRLKGHNVYKSLYIFYYFLSVYIFLYFILHCKDTTNHIRQLYYKHQYYE